MPHVGDPVTGRTVDLAARPEAIASAPAGEAGWTATVAQVIYLEAVTHPYLRLGNGTELVARRQNRTGEPLATGLQPGYAVVAHGAADGSHLLATRP